MLFHSTPILSSKIYVIFTVNYNIIIAIECQWFFKFKYTGKNVESVIDRLPTAKIISEDDGSYIITAEVFGNNIDMWIKSQGNYIEVIE